MNIESIKTFLLVILVGASFMLSFALWSYQPKYESLYNPDYVSEIDVGGKERFIGELIEPSNIFFRTEDLVYGFKRPAEQQKLFKALSTWVLYDVSVQDVGVRSTNEDHVEIIFPAAIPAELIPNLFTLNEVIASQLWSFDNMYITLDEESLTLKVRIISIDNRKELTATIEKSETYNNLAQYFSENQSLEAYTFLQAGNSMVYLPADEVSVSKRTLVASVIKPELFFNALFPNPTIVTPNLKEAYFTDGTRGMRILEGNRTLEFINPIQENYEQLDTASLLDLSMNHINNHKGWTNDYIFENMERNENSIRYRQYYDGYPLLASPQTAVIEQQWREGDLFQYTRPLIQMGNILNSEQVLLPAGTEIVELLEEDAEINLEKIKDIKVGYAQSYLDEAHSVVLIPNWYMLYNGEWKRIQYVSDNERINSLGRD